MYLPKLITGAERKKIVVYYLGYYFVVLCSVISFDKYM